MAKVTKDQIKFYLSLDTAQTQQSLADLSKESADLKEKIKSAQTALDSLSKAGLEGSASWKSTQAELKQYNLQLEVNAKKTEELEKNTRLGALSLAELEKRQKMLRQELRHTSAEDDPGKFKALKQRIEEHNAAILKAKEAMGEMTTATRKTAEATEGSAKRFKGLGAAADILRGALMQVGRTMLDIVVGSLRNAVATITDFEAANSKLAAILGTTEQGIKALTDEARRLGATTSYSASQVTELQVELAKLGFTQQQIADMEGGVLKFAKAVGTDLASAAAFAGASMRIFNIDAARSEEMLATLAVGTTRSALDFGYLQSAMSTIGPVANAFGFSIEDTTALLGSLANAGFDASTAATATRNILLNLADSNGKLAQALGQPVKNLDDLTAGLKKLDAEGVDLAQVLELTDKRSVAVFSTFLNNVGSLNELKRSVTGASKAFTDMSGTMGGNVKGSLASLSSAVEGLILKFYDAKGPLKWLIDAFTSAVSAVGNVIDWISRFGSALAIAGAAIGGYIAGVKALVVIKQLQAKAHGQSLTAMLAETVAMKAQTVTTNAWRGAVLLVSAAKAALTGNLVRAKAAMLLFNTTCMANPLGLLLGAVAAITAAFIHFKNKAQEAAKAEKEWQDALKQANEKYTSARANIAKLTAIAENERISLVRRKEAIAELNKIVPLYNAHLDATSGKYSANKKALDDYLASMKQEALAKAYQMQLDREAQKVTEAQIRLDRLEEAKANAIKLKNHYWNGGKGRNTRKYKEWAKNVNILTRKANEAQEALSAAENAFDNLAKKVSNKIEIPTTPAPLEDPTPDKPITRQPDNPITRQPDNPETPSPLKTLEANYQQRLAISDVYFSTLKDRVTQAAVENRQIEEATQLFQLNAQREHTQNKIAALKQYLDEVQNAEGISNDERFKKEQEIANQLRQLQSQELTQTAAYAVRLRELANDPHSPQTLKEQYEQRREILAAEYTVALQMASDNADLRKQLEEEQTRRLNEMWEEYYSKITSLKKDETTLTKEQYDRELQQLEEMHAQGLVDEEEYQKKRKKIQDKGFDNETGGPKGTKEWLEFTGKMLGKAGEIFSTLQQTEITASDAKYDALIAQAKENGEDTAALEQEKENAKLDIQKKYADTQMVIKIAEIGANTAVAIMTALAQLGPIAGPIAASLMGAMGAVQIAQAIVERNKIKNARPGSAASSSASSSVKADVPTVAEPKKPTATRTVTGYSEGGYTGPGGRYEVAGLVHRGEYVVPMPIMSHPRVADAVGMIESIRLGRMGRVASSTQGYADGGYTGEPSGATASTDLNDMTEAVRGLRSATENIRDIRAYVVYRDIKDTEASINKARKAFAH